MWLMATILDNAGLQQDQCDNLTSDVLRELGKKIHTREVKQGKMVSLVVLGRGCLCPENQDLMRVIVTKW